jgi:hypothetical protein
MVAVPLPSPFAPTLHAFPPGVELVTKVEPAPFTNPPPLISLAPPGHGAAALPAVNTPSGGAASVKVPWALAKMSPVTSRAVTLLARMLLVVTEFLGAILTPATAAVPPATAMISASVAAMFE